MAGLAAVGVVLGGPGLGEAEAGAALRRLPGRFVSLRDALTLLGDSGGLRPALEARGLAVDLFWNHQVGLFHREGTSGDTTESGSADLFVRMDLGRTGLVPGGIVLLQAKTNYNRGPNDAVAALGDPFDDADDDLSVYVDQLWYERAFAEGRVRPRLGYQDLQVTFDRNAYANSEDTQFMNAALDNDPLVPLEIGLAASAVVAPWRWVELAVAVADAEAGVRELGLDTVFDGTDSWSTLMELTLRGDLGEGRHGALRLGAFRDGEARPLFGAGREEHGHWGGWLSADALVWPEGEGDGDGEGTTRPGEEQGIGIFARAALADGRVNRFDAFWSAGLAWTGALPGRDADALGLGVYQALPSDNFRDRVDPGLERETGAELYYRVQVTPWLALTPDVQWIEDPRGRTAAPDALVLALRARVRF